MGEVYLAEDVAAERRVAIKFLLAPNGPGALSRFLTEIRALARLDHPNIVRVLSHDLYRATPFFTMDYVPNGTLSDRVFREGPLRAAEAARVIATAARAVHAAHGADILHRDLKPSNVLLAEDGTPRVSDFGLAKRTDRDEGLTTRSGPLGTPGYMPPEQVSNRLAEIGPAADVYGLGATLYHLLTGRPPFSGSESELYTRIMRAPPERPRAVRRDVPMELEGIVLKCLEKQPADRYPTAAALADDLDRFLAGKPPEAPLLTRGRRLRRWVAFHRRQFAVAALALAVVVAAFAVGAAVWPRPDPAGPADRLHAPPPGRPVVGLPAPRMTHEEARARLKAGEEVTLLDAGGPLTPVVWEFGSCDIVPPRPGAAFSLKSPGEVVLRLLPDPGIDRYRLRAVVRQDMILSEAQPGAPESYSRAGLSVAHDLVQPTDKREIHTLLTAGFRDAAGSRGAYLADRVVVDRPLRSFEGCVLTTAEQALDPSPDGWRVVELDVTPRSVTLTVDGRAVSTELPYLKGRRADEWRHELRDDAGRPLALPDPSPRRPLGLWVSCCWASFRSVTIRPLP
jgi:hypothetical protein